VNDFVDYSCANINVLELKAVLVAAERWGPSWSGQHVVVRSDNMSTIASINKGSSRSIDMLKLVQEMFWCSVRYSFKLSAVHLPGKLNIVSDRISRMADFGSACEASLLLFNGYSFPIDCGGHMSYSTYLSLQEGWNRVLMC
jgi:hypothetical protein